MKNLVVLILIMTSLSTQAQQLKDFSLPNAIDGKIITLESYAASPGIVIIFTLNNCPFDDYYSKRIKSLAQQKIPVLLVNSSSDPAESVANMTKRAVQLNFEMPYLADKDFALIQQLNAHKSTEVFLLKNANGKFTVFYHGAIDDNAQVADDVKHTYLKDAIDSMLSGQPLENTETRPVGCNIRRN
jgi:peroxiredoxin